ERSCPTKSASSARGELSGSTVSVICGDVYRIRILFSLAPFVEGLNSERFKVVSEGAERFVFHDRLEPFLKLWHWPPDCRPSLLSSLSPLRYPDLDPEEKSNDDK